MNIYIILPDHKYKGKDIIFVNELLRQEHWEEKSDFVLNFGHED